MILADTSIWVEHLLGDHPRLLALLEAGAVFGGARILTLDRRLGPAAAALGVA